MHEFFLRPTYWNWVSSEAALIDTDGCSNVFGSRIDCCYEHDLAYFYGRDPHDAYLRYRGGTVDPWVEAKTISRTTVDARFRRCHQNRSCLGMYSPMALWRWLGVRVGGALAWARHRHERPQPLAPPPPSVLS